MICLYKTNCVIRQLTYSSEVNHINQTSDLSNQHISHICELFNLFHKGVNSEAGRFRLCARILSNLSFLQQFVSGLGPWVVGQVERLGPPR